MPCVDRFMRQRSEPGTGEDPYAFPPATPGMEGSAHPRLSVADAFNVPPGTPQPVRMPERQMSMPGQYDPHCEKTCLQGFRPGPTQARLYIHRGWLEACNFVFRKKRD